MAPVSQLQNRIRDTIVMFYSVVLKEKENYQHFIINGNTGQDGLSWQDNDKFGGGDGNVSMSMDDDGNVNYEWTGGNNDEEPNVDTQNGFIKTPMQACSI
jgi:hypothetical protein